jgi:DNA helicase-2/ATP-dependent DNA helicase PcrA
VGRPAHDNVSLDWQSSSVMATTVKSLQNILLAGLTKDQAKAVRATERRLLVVAGAGSGKTEVMARRAAWKVAVDGERKDSIVAFTFTERAAEEMKFRIRAKFEAVAETKDDRTLGDMYIGTIHGFCLKSLRSLAPDRFHNYDILEEASRLSMVAKGYTHLLGLSALGQALGSPYFETINTFLQGYDLLNEYGLLDVELASAEPPGRIAEEADWCKSAVLKTKVGTGSEAQAFARSAARFYAYLHCRRFLDFSTSQAELVRLLERNPEALAEIRTSRRVTIVDEVQDINPVQDRLIRLLVGADGSLTAVGDHRQAIFGWRGGRVDIMGRLFSELKTASDGSIVELTENFRSTNRIISISNSWAHSIGAVETMTSPDMKHGNVGRDDYDGSHVGAIAFPDRAAEAAWIAKAIKKLVQRSKTTSNGARHDAQTDDRGLGLTDIAILIRSATDARTYEAALRAVGIPAIFRAGPDLFAQPEILLFVAVLSHMAGIDQFYGQRPRSIGGRVTTTLGCNPTPVDVITTACTVLRQEGLQLAPDTAKRLLLLGSLVQRRLAGEIINASETVTLTAPAARELLRGRRQVRRVFPQKLFHLALEEAGVSAWEEDRIRGAAALFQLGALSGLISGIERPGWNSVSNFKFDMIALSSWGSQNGRTEEAPLMVGPDAVTISTIHAAKGLEYAAVFVADVVSQRFPSSFATRQPTLPFDGPILKTIDPAHLADNANKDDERRLMYVALTRAERYLYVTSSKTSLFIRELVPLTAAAGGYTGPPPGALASLTKLPTQVRRDVRLVSSFSDLRYYLECPHDFYLRKVLGFAPTIDQAFGYGRGVHNLMRAVHSDAKTWSELTPNEVRDRLQLLIDRGLFYMRYTTGDPLKNMEDKALRLVARYIETYGDELSRLEFEPEREFETLIEEEQLLVSGAIDVVRLDNPPRVTLIDFKSGESDSELSSKLDKDEMRLQVSLYGLAARQELEYQPDRGLVRYLDEDDPAQRELEVKLDDGSLAEARAVAVQTAAAIRRRKFFEGPTRTPRNARHTTRCGECDFLEFCGLPPAAAARGERRNS